MAASTFDTLTYLQKLKQSGMSDQQAEAITQATHSAISQVLENRELSTKLDLKENINNLEMRLTKTIYENTWRIITIIGGIQAIVLGLFAISQFLIK